MKIRNKLFQRVVIPLDDMMEYSFEGCRFEGCYFTFDEGFLESVKKSSVIHYLNGLMEHCVIEGCTFWEIDRSWVTKGQTYEKRWGDSEDQHESEN